MTHNGGFDETIATWLHEKGDSSSPRYLDQVLATTSAARQRPSWSGLAGWLPGQRAVDLVGPWRTARLLLVMALLAALTAAALVIGSQPRLPAPLGLAGNGTILYGTLGGDLASIDLGTGSSTTVLGGIPWDETPDFSHDGTRMVFARRAEIEGLWMLMVARADGADTRPLTGPIYPTWNVWSPDDSSVAVVDTAPVIPTLTLYYLDGRQPTVIDTDGWLAEAAAFRPDGREIVYLGVKGGSYGLFATPTTGVGPTRTIVPPVFGQSVEHVISAPALSPDGATVAYTRWQGDQSSVHLVDVDSGAGSDRRVQLDSTSDGENLIGWSPDGGRLMIQRQQGSSTQLAISEPGGGEIRLLGPVTPTGTGGADVVFSPDGRQAIARYEWDGSYWLLDLAGGPGTSLALPPSASVSWQRVAP